MKKAIISLALVFFPIGIYASEINGSLNTDSLNNGIQMNLPCNPDTVPNGQVNATTCEISCNPNYSLSGTSCLLNGSAGGSGGGGGGGGGSGGGGVSIDFCPSGDTSSSYLDGLCAPGVPMTLRENNVISTVTGMQEIIGNMRVSTKLEGDERVAQLTSASGVIILRSSKNSLVKVTIPSGVTVRSDKDWDGTIKSPVAIRSESADKAGAAVLLAGNSNHSLQFNKEITISVPSSLKDGREVFIYYSNHPDLSDLKKQGAYKVANGSLDIPSDHLSHFILKKKAQNLSGNQKFNDTSGSFAKEDIDNLAFIGVVKGFKNGDFKPDKTTTRAEYLAMAMKTMDIPIDDKIVDTSFTDISKEGSWIIKYVEKAKEMGVINGQLIGGQLKFRPNDPISRAEAISILLNVSKISIDKSADPEFMDVNVDWMKPYIATAQSLGIVKGQLIGGQLKFRPNDPITRAESARIINKVLIDYPLPPSISI